MNDIFLKTYNGVPLWLYLEKVDVLGNNQRAIREKVGIDLPSPELEGTTILRLVRVDTDEETFDVEVWAHNLTDKFLSFQFDFDGREGGPLILPDGVDFTGVTIGPAFDYTWYIGSQREDGHIKEGLIGAGSGIAFQPTGEPLLLATGSFIGPWEAAKDVVIRRAGIAFYSLRHKILQTDDVFPGA